MMYVPGRCFGAAPSYSIPLIYMIGTVEITFAGWDLDCHGSCGQFSRVGSVFPDLLGLSAAESPNVCPTKRVRSRPIQLLE